MTPKLRIRRRRRSFSRHGAAKSSNLSGGLAILVTTILLAIILMTGPLILGAARLWVELPLLCGVAVLLVLQGARLAAKPSADSRRWADAIDLSVVLFVLYAIVRWLTSPCAYFSRIEAMEVVAYAGVFLTCRHGMANRKLCLAILYLLVLLGVGETAFGYYLSNHLDWFPFGVSEHLHVYYAPRWVGSYGSPNNYASLLVMATAAALALGSFSKLPWPVRIVLFYLALMMIVGVICSGSRGGWMALTAAICGLVIMGIRHGTMRWWVPATGALVLIIFIVFLFSQSQIAHTRLHEIKQEIMGGNLKTDLRVQLAVDALRIAHDHPLFGTGPGTFGFIHPRYQDGTFAFKAELTHDDYLNCLDDYGLVGFGLALFFVLAVTLNFFRPLLVDNRWQDRVLVGAGFAAWLALLVHSLVDFNLHIPANAMLLFALTGFAVGRSRQEKVKHWSTISLSPVGHWLGAGVIVLSLIYGFEVARTTLSDEIYQNVFTREDVVPISESIKGAGNALYFDPANEQDLVLLGDLYRGEALLQKTSQDRLDEAQMALDAYQRALQANLLDDSVQARTGLALDLMQKYPEALPHFQAAVEAQPYNGQFWFWLAKHYQENGQPKEAAQAYAKAGQCPPGNEKNFDSQKPPSGLPKANPVNPANPDFNSMTVPPPSNVPATIP
jgi:O-antigen ligase